MSAEVVVVPRATYEAMAQLVRGWDAWLCVGQPADLLATLSASSAAFCGSDAGSRMEEPLSDRPLLGWSCTTFDCESKPSTWVVLVDCEDDPCTGHGYCRSCADLLTVGPMPAGVLGHEPTAERASVPLTESRWNSRDGES